MPRFMELDLEGQFADPSYYGDRPALSELGSGNHSWLAIRHPATAVPILIRRPCAISVPR